MGEREQHHLATIAAEAMYGLLELQWQAGEVDLDAAMMRLKDLSAYSLSHADIQERRQGVELLALGMLFGMSSDTRYQENQARLHTLSEEAVGYEGQAERIAEEIQQQSTSAPSPNTQPSNDDQPSLF